ncbi:MAG: hypothetical protein ACPLSJ_00500 [Thermosulfidibacteraceae bacterium]
MRRILRLTLILVFTLFFSCVTRADIGKYDYYTAVRETVEKLKSLLELPEGKVEKVIGDRVYISFPNIKGIRINSFGMIYKPGDYIRDPKTGKVYPGVDIPLASFTVEDVKGGYAIGRILKANDRIIPGYTVRSISEACVQVEKGEAKGIDVDLEKLRETVKFVFAEDMTFNVDRSGCLLDIVVKPFLSSGVGGEVLLTLKMAIGNFTARDFVAKVSSVVVAVESSVEGEGAFLSRVFNKSYRLVVTYDVNGDGKDEILLAGDGFVDVMGVDESKELKVLASYDLGKRANMMDRTVYFDKLHIGNDTLIVWSFIVNDVINGLYKAYPKTYILKFSGKKVEKIAEVDYLVRVVDLGGKEGDVIIGWDLNEYGEFDGSPFVVTYSKGKFIKEKKKLEDFLVKVKALGTLYGWYYGVVDDSSSRYFVVVKNGSLEFYDDNANFVATLNDPVGPYSAISFYATPRFFTPPAKRDFEPIEVAKRFYFERRIDSYKLPDGFCIFTIAHDLPSLSRFGIQVSSDYFGNSGRVIGIKRTGDRRIMNFYVAIETPKYYNAYALDFSLGKLDKTNLYIIQLSYLTNVNKVRIDIYKIGKRES